jgi:hypothetical protein
MPEIWDLCKINLADNVYSKCQSKLFTLSQCTRMSAKRPFTKQYLELLEKHNDALDQHISFLESRLAQCQKEHGGFRDPQIQSRPVMPLSPNDFEMDLADEESNTESDTDSDGGPDIKQLIAPRKRLVVRVPVMKHQVLCIDTLLVT